MATREFLPNCSIQTHIIDASYPRLPETVVDPEAKLQLAVDEYTIHNARPNAATLIITHGTSFNKKLWEPTISRMLRLPLLERNVRRIIALDATNHGESWLLNSNKLTNKSHWPDQSRDILTTLRHFKVQQPVIGIGHSFGGGIMCHATMLDPAAFYATIFIDPILFQLEAETGMIAERALKRRDVWNSLEDAEKAFTRNKGYSDWNTEVLSLHINHSTIDSHFENGIRRILKTPKEQEAATYIAAPHPKLPQMLASSNQYHYFILGEKSFAIYPKDQQWIQSIVKPPGKVIVLKNIGHLIPMTHPDETAATLATILAEILGNRTSQRCHMRGLL